MADDAKGKGPQQREESVAPKKKVTSQMLLNKFQCDQERRQYREESARRREGHWKCPFFVYCWEEGLTQLIVDNCPECNTFYCENWSFKKPRFDQRPRGPIIRERSNDRHISVHDRLGAGFQCMIGWGAGPCYVILQEEGFLSMSESNKLLLLIFLMSTHTAKIPKECMFMTTLIGLDGVQED